MIAWGDDQALLTAAIWCRSRVPRDNSDFLVRLLQVADHLGVLLLMPVEFRELVGRPPAEQFGQQNDKNLLHYPSSAVWAAARVAPQPHG
jgi:hypothetical protein